MHKNFQRRGNRKCRVQKSSVTNLTGGALRETNANSFTWICFGEMLKGDRSELVRDATVLSPVSILFCTGSPYEGNGEEEEEDKVEEEADDAEDNESIKYGVIYIDEGVKFKIDKTLIYPVEVLRGLIHTALENIVLTNNNNNAVKNKLINDGVETIINVLNDGHRSCGDILPQQSAYNRRGNDHYRNRNNNNNYNNRGGKNNNYNNRGKNGGWKKKKNTSSSYNGTKQNKNRKGTFKKKDGSGGGSGGNNF